MALKTVVESLDDVDEAFRSEYKQVEDPVSKKKVYMVDLTDVQALPDFTRMRTSLDKERNEHRATKEKFKPFAALGDPAEVIAKLDKIPELEAAAEGKLDEGKINTIVESRVKAKLAPVERERDQFKAQVVEKDTVIAGYTAKERTTAIKGALGKAGREMKVLDTAAEDIELYGDRLFEVSEDGNVVTRDNVGVTPGLTPKQWLEDMQAKRPHWWGATSGGGAGGNRFGPNSGGAGNPWSAEGWNMTEQGKVLNTKGRAEADRLAKAAGTTVGGARPVKKK